MILRDPVANIELEVFTQATPVPSDCVMQVGGACFSWLIIIRNSVISDLQLVLLPCMAMSEWMCNFWNFNTC